MNINRRVTKDAEVRTTSQYKQVVNFSVAINESYRNKQGERVEQTIEKQANDVVSHLIKVFSSIRGFLQVNFR